MKKPKPAKVRPRYVWVHVDRQGYIVPYDMRPTRRELINEINQRYDGCCGGKVPWPYLRKKGFRLRRLLISEGGG